MSEVKKATRASKKTAVATVDASPAKPAAGGGLEGAERNTRATFNWNPAIISPDQQIARDKDMADARAQDMVQNDGYAFGAVAIHRDSIVGSQYKLNAKPNSLVLGAPDGWAEEFQSIVESRFNMAAPGASTRLPAWFASRSAGF